MCNTRFSSEREGASRGTRASAEASPELLDLRRRSHGGPGWLETKASPCLSFRRPRRLAVSGNSNGPRVVRASETDGARGEAPSRGLDTCQHQLLTLAGLRPLSGVRPCSQLTATVGTHSIGWASGSENAAARGWRAVPPAGRRAHAAAARSSLCGANRFAGPAAATFLPLKASE